jgi:hypothetical protein
MYYLFQRLFSETRVLCERKQTDIHGFYKYRSCENMKNVLVLLNDPSLWRNELNDPRLTLSITESNYALDERKKTSIKLPFTYDQNKARWKFNGKLLRLSRSEFIWNIQSFGIIISVHVQHLFAHKEKALKMSHLSNFRSSQKIFILRY